jgi:hypothetical protein
MASTYLHFDLFNFGHLDLANIGDNGLKYLGKANWPFLEYIYVYNPIYHVASSLLLFKYAQKIRYFAQKRL